MSFADSVRTVLTKYAVFSGRARRSEYWWFVLFNFIVGVVVGIIDAVIKTSILQIIVALALLLPSLGVLVRRLHDTGRSGFWVFIGLIPLIGAIVLIVFACMDSQPGENQFGPSPKGGYGHATNPGYGQAPA